jgi:hypothetical protein
MNAIFISLLLYRIMKDFNLPQVNSVAPMSLASHNDFVAHHKTSYPFSQTAPIPVFHKIVLHAADRVSGSVTQANFHINLQNPLPKNAVLCVKDFMPIYEDEIDTPEENKNYIVALPQLLAKNSYQTSTQNSSDILFVGKNIYNNQVVAGTAGVPIADTMFFSNKQITINIGTNATITDWVLILIVYAYE